MGTVTLTLEEYNRLVEMANSIPQNTVAMELLDSTSKPKKKGKKTTAYQRAYKRSFKRVAPKYKKRNGEWKKGGFKAAVRQAHKEAKK